MMCLVYNRVSFTIYCRYLSALLNRADVDVDDGLAAYRGAYIWRRDEEYTFSVYMVMNLAIWPNSHSRRHHRL